MEIFEEKGRLRRSDDSSPEAVEKMAARYRRDAGLYWSVTLAEIERVKRLYQTGIQGGRGLTTLSINATRQNDGKHESWDEQMQAQKNPTGEIGFSCFAPDGGGNDQNN